MEGLSHDSYFQSSERAAGLAGRADADDQRGVECAAAFEETAWPTDRDALSVVFLSRQREVATTGRKAVGREGKMMETASRFGALILVLAAG